MAEQAWFGVGNLARDPELKFTAGGRAVAKASIAVERRYQRDGKWEGETSWFNLVVWGELGEHFAESCFKGDRVFAAGRIEIRNYETAEGEKRTALEVVVDSIGPDLKYATAIVNKVERSKPENESSYE